MKLSVLRFLSLQEFCKKRASRQGRKRSPLFLFEPDVCIKSACRNLCAIFCSECALQSLRAIIGKRTGIELEREIGGDVAAKGLG